MNTPNPNMASESTTSAARKAVVVGAGPVGCLSAIALAKMGWNVEIYEGRPDMRLPSSKAEAQLRSINLAMSARGIAATKVISPAAADRFLKAVVPMHARMIHYVTGQQESQPYDRYGECINSIDRSYMNECLLEDAIAIPNVRVLFNHKVVSIDFDSRKMVVQDAASGQNTRVSFSLCVGADGSYSIVRRQLMRVVRMNYQQEYIPHEYLELRMPAGPADITGEPTFLLDPNHLHIWPRHTFMLVALPNQDKTFTCTVFAPTAEFDRLDTPEVIIKWFKTYFSDALHLIGEDALLHDFHRNPRSPLMVVKATPYHFKDRAIILGDAAHAMVPFYGQGLNCGLEDVRVLDILLRSERVDPDYQVPEGTEDVQLANALRKYTESRHEDLVAICDLAMANYVEMRHDVITPAYLFRKALDNVLYAISSTHVTLNSLIPVLSRVPFSPNPSTGWLPQYTMVTFRPDISYSTVKRLASKQKRILEYTGWASAAVGVGLASITCVTGLRRFWNRG
ncbi:FAD/NAD-P-binding domain-containing protein [Sparassis latifolia]|uniref:Kynurenine 3-monooxygenase n=1 Tax=Sparassis crispa TaxID=139825 RepID=A0A401GIK2_9APHY|nr:Kynurenine 3-monooxygenase [Sparassis crispa]GBE82002.1 Kynurenine 3-monooxygenase [Sparassis crispa]